MEPNLRSNLCASILGRLNGTNRPLAHSLLKKEGLRSFQIMKLINISIRLSIRARANPGKIKIVGRAKEIRVRAQLKMYVRLPRSKVRKKKMKLNRQMNQQARMNYG